MYKATVNGRQFEIERKGDQWFIDGKALAWEVSSLSSRQFHVLLDRQGYQAEMVKIDRATKSVELKVGGKKFQVQLRDDLDLLLEKMGMNTTDTARVNTIKAPMPGLIIDLRIKEGDTVKPGDPLLVLEAMKMENIIKATGEGVVKQVKVKKGDSVEKGQLLIAF